MESLRETLERVITNLQMQKQSLCEVDNVNKDRLIISATHKAIDRIDGAIAELNELF
jgi:hypothetical protein